jgi:hypothetical protein
MCREHARMKFSVNWALFLGLLVSGLGPTVGCTYQAPQVQATGGAGGTSASSSSGGGEGGSSGQGGSASCTPGEIKLCLEYSGPAETLDIGVCRASKSECLMSGTSAPCSQEVIPTVETCAESADVNCDKRQPCSGTPIGSNPFNEAQTDKAELILAMATASGSKGQDGPVYAVGARNGVTPPDPLDLFEPLIWQLDSNGIMHDWSSRIQFTPQLDPNGAMVRGVGVIPTTGTVAVTGFFVGGILKIGQSTTLDAPNLRSFYAQLSPMGEILNSRILNIGGDMHATAMTVDSSGNSYIVGYYAGQPVVDGIMFPGAGNGRGFILALKPNGDYLWHKPFGGGGTHSIEGIASIDGEGLIIATRFTGAVVVDSVSGMPGDFDGGAEPDLLVSRLQLDNGLAVWNKVVASSNATSNILIGGLAANKDRVVVSGRFNGSITINISHTNPNGMDAADSFVIGLNPVGGNIDAHYVSEGNGLQDIRGVAIDSAGDVIFTGAYSNNFTFTNKNLPSPSGIDTFVIKTNNFLNVKWSQVFSGTKEQFGQAVVVGKQAGYIYAGGAFIQELTGVNPSLEAAGSSDAFLITLSD